MIQYTHVHVNWHTMHTPQTHIRITHTLSHTHAITHTHIHSLSRDSLTALSLMDKTDTHTLSMHTCLHGHAHTHTLKHTHRVIFIVAHTLCVCKH